MKNLHLIFITITALFFTACNQDQSSSNIRMVKDTYHQVPTGYTNQETTAPKLKAPRGEDRENQILIAKIKSQEKLDLAKIEAETAQKVKAIEVEALKTKALVDKDIAKNQHKIEKEIASSNQQIVLKTQEKDLYLYKIITMVIGFIVLIGILVVYLINRENRIVQVKLEADRLKHEEFTQANNQYHEKSTKILDIIADKNSDDMIKQELVKILGYQEQNTNQTLLAQSPENEDEIKDANIIEEK
ncbi:hypothetical protein MNB_SV-9-1709 [hydrothermal vent metagenome]|uniref:Uncharacterized protein n=1 Tax=hydrothermal vent metagenome TaxID=652676 RepID=A0A1W1CGV1_9ZZZZ